MRFVTGDRARPRAVVVGLDCITGLQTARILSRRGVPVVGVASDPEHFCSHTRVCERIRIVETGSEALIDELVRLSSDGPDRAVLFPCTDASVWIISEHRTRLLPYFHIALPAHEKVRLLMLKSEFYRYAEEQGYPIARTRALNGETDMEAAAFELVFPCILKPERISAEWSALGGKKVYRVAHPQDLRNLYGRVGRKAGTLIVQEWIEGGDADLYSCNCYFDRDSNALVTFVARKLRQWPPEAGTSALGEECRNETVLEATIQLFREVGWHGLGYLEMKWDENRGAHFMIEPNVGRPTGRSAIADGAGVSLLYTMYCDLLGLPLPLGRTQRFTGMKWIYLRHDFQSAFFYWRRGQLTLREWLASLRGPKTYAVFSLSDPAPFWRDLWDTAMRMLRRGSANHE